MKNADIPEVMRAIRIFSDLSPEAATMLYAKMNFRLFEPDEFLFKEGDYGDEFFIILKGAVSITVNLPDGKELVLSKIEAGNFFGEMAIIDRSPRSASCKTLEKTECLSLNALQFNSLMEENPDIACSIMNRMLSIAASRLTANGAFLSQLVQFGEASRKRAIIDPATGLFNRRYMDESFAALVARAALDNKKLSFVMFDLDHFGSLNSEYGLTFGDKVIAQAAQSFKKIFREKDLLIRYGGDEFIFILPDAKTEEAQCLCDNLCAEFRTLRFPEQPSLRLTCSMGFACYPDHASSHETLMANADKALYAAKQTGRDRALCYAAATPEEKSSR
jgi:diguanylate cyclase (GGDEF)-like protein